jgi:uncharacterized DUF497 family protein
MFSWDASKARINHEKHGVAFEVAATVFADPDGLDWEDSEHSEHSEHSKDERRYKRLGRSVAGRILLTVYTVMRTPHGKEIIRLISARQASRKEPKTYAG